MAAMAAIQAMPPGHALLHRQLAGPVLAQLGWVQPGTLLEKKVGEKGKSCTTKCEVHLLTTRLTSDWDGNVPYEVLGTVTQ